jgi:hypothetical protein
MLFLLQLLAPNDLACIELKIDPQFPQHLQQQLHL